MKFFLLAASFVKLGCFWYLAPCANIYLIFLYSSIVALLGDMDVKLSILKQTSSTANRSVPARPGLAGMSACRRVKERGRPNSTLRQLQRLSPAPQVTRTISGPFSNSVTMR